MPFTRTQEKRKQENWADIAQEDVAQLCPVDISHSGYQKVKRVLDVLFSMAGMLLLCVPAALIAVILWLDDPGPVFFCQERVGLHGKTFMLYKFRTMKVNAPRYVSSLDFRDSGIYVTRIGAILRKSSLDEIPQLYNVLKGDMSLVGPRPLIAAERDIHRYRMYFGVYNIRPGVTGLAQINGRDQLRSAEKLCWDVAYMENYGLLQDLRIMLSTLPLMVHKHPHGDAPENKSQIHGSIDRK